MSVSVSVVFTGLCAIVGGGNGRPAEVLLLDAARVGEVRGAALPSHAPTLVVSLNDLANPDTSAPTRVVVGRTGPDGRVDQIGLWDLSGSEVRIRVQGGAGTGVRFFRPAPEKTTWPEPPPDPHDPAAWRDIRYVADMSAVVGDGRIAPDFVADGSVAGGQPPAVAARIHLEGGLLEGGLPSQATYRGDRFEFRGARGAGRLRQALTDSVQWSLETGGAAVAIDITPLDGGSSRRLLLSAGPAPRRIFVSNLPGANHADAHATHALSDEEMAALHFGAYYALLLNRPEDLLLPQLWRPRPERKGSGLIRPVICPPALFSRP